ERAPERSRGEAAADRPERAPRGHEAEQPLPLPAAHEPPERGPEDEHGDRVELLGDDHEEGERARHVRDDHQPERQQRGPENAEDPAQEARLIGARNQPPDGDARAGKQNRVGEEHDRQALDTDALQEVRVGDVGDRHRRACDEEQGGGPGDEHALFSPLDAERAPPAPRDSGHVRPVAEFPRRVAGRAQAAGAPCSVQRRCSYTITRAAASQPVTRMRFTSNRVWVGRASICTPTKTVRAAMPSPKRTNSESIAGLARYFISAVVGSQTTWRAVLSIE